MSAVRRALLLGIGVALAAGCGGGAPPPTPPPAPGPVAVVPPSPAVAPKDPGAGPPLAAMSYSANQRRDPFTPLVVVEGASKGVTVASAKLAGVIQGRQGPLGLVEAPDGIGYVLKVGDVLGDGRVAAVTPDSISFSVAARPGQSAQTVTLRLRTD